MEEYKNDKTDFLEKAPKRRQSGFGLGILVGIASTVIVYLLLVVTNVASLPTNPNARFSKNEWNTFIQKANTITNILDAKFIDEMDNKKMQDGMLYGMTAALGDVYTTYLDQERFQKLMEDTDGTYVGIGVSVLQDPDDGFLQIVQVFTGSPAEKAGLQSGDKIINVNEESMAGLEQEEVIKKIKGPKDTQVKITVYRASEKDSFTLDVGRDRIIMDTVKSKMLENNIGYIQITGFDGVTAKQFKEEFAGLKSKGMESLVVDLRHNPGGRLDIVNDILDEFLPKGIITYTIDAQGQRQEYVTRDNVYFNKPLAVLVNENSASASEIFSGSVKDYGVGTIVGTTTFGKGKVQTIYPLNDGSALRVTISKYYTPNGDYIHGTGIEPDIKVELPKEYKYRTTIPEDVDDQLNAAIDILEKQMK